MSADLVDWLSAALDEFAYRPLAILGASPETLPAFSALNEAELHDLLWKAGLLSPLPTEPAALAAILEAAVSNFIFSKLSAEAGLKVKRGSPRNYPAFDVVSEHFGQQPFAIDIKVARRHKNGKNTQSRITLFTGNTYFRYPAAKWDGMVRPFAEYGGHVHIFVLYDLTLSGGTWIPASIEFIVSEPWRVASRQRSSTTREYIGAVTKIEQLTHGQGEFSSQEDFYKYWRSFDFRIGKAAQRQLDKLLSQGNLL
ncbi:MAG TPA: type II restriction endonuclease [Devosiaceae bacterium]|jgi:hypothetical protein